MLKTWIQGFVRPWLSWRHLRRTSHRVRRTRRGQQRSASFFQAYFADGAGTSRRADEPISKGDLEARKAEWDSDRKKRLRALEECEEKTKVSNDEGGQKSTEGRPRLWRDRFQPYSSRAVKVATDGGHCDNLR